MPIAKELFKAILKGAGPAPLREGKGSPSTRAVNQAQVDVIGDDIREVMFPTLRDQVNYLEKEGEHARAFVLGELDKFYKESRLQGILIEPGRGGIDLDLFMESMQEEGLTRRLIDETFNDLQRADMIRIHSATIGSEGNTKDIFAVQLGDKVPPVMASVRPKGIRAQVLFDLLKTGANGEIPLQGLRVRMLQNNGGKTSEVNNALNEMQKSGLIRIEQRADESWVVTPGPNAPDSL